MNMVTPLVEFISQGKKWSSERKPQVSLIFLRIGNRVSIASGPWFIEDDGRVGCK